MYSSYNNNVSQKTNIIPINNSKNTKLNTPYLKGEYSLKKNCFDPTKNSPPNEFMIKLYMRMNIYNDSYRIDNNFVSE